MPEKTRNVDDFSQACREYAESRDRHTGNIGCIVSLAAGAVLSILIGVWSGFAWLGLMLFFVLPSLMAMGYGALLLLLPDAERDRVTAMIDDYVADRLEWVDCPNYVVLHARGLPHGSQWQSWLNCDTGQFSTVERRYLEWVIEDPEGLTLDRASSVANDALSEAELSDFRRLVAHTPVAGTLELRSTVMDGMPFTLEVVRGGQKRVCKGNLAGLPEADTEAPEIKVAQMLLALSDPDVAGTATCGKNGEITVYTSDTPSSGVHTDEQDLGS